MIMCQGWQYRWFVLEPSAGVLEYYLLEDRNGRCRASQSMAGAVISPSQEDENTFTINFTSGETYKVTSDFLEDPASLYVLSRSEQAVPGRDRSGLTGSGTAASSILIRKYPPAS